MSRQHFKPSEHFRKPSKPYPEFPLFAHNNGTWAKKIRGRLHYFGGWDDPDAALAKYLAEKDHLHAGRHPAPTPAAVTVKDVCNAFLNSRQQRLDAGELSLRFWQDLKEACDLLVDHFGKHARVADLRPDDFGRLRARMAKRWGPVRLGNVIHRVKSVFKYALEVELIERPVRFGPDFAKPSAGVMRRHRAKGGGRMLEAADLRRLLDAAGVSMRAMILLGLNLGYGNTDCSALPITAVDLDAGVIDFPRPKSGVRRRGVLWPETVAALREVLAERPRPKDAAAGLVFVNERGSPWTVATATSKTDNVAVQFRQLLDRTGLRRRGLGFYALRHVFRTIADEARDPAACDLIMGHSDPSMAGHYRERISDARLRAVADHVRQWLFGGEVRS